jgi:hypothetical protein
MSELVHTSSREMQVLMTLTHKTSKTLGSDASLLPCPSISLSHYAEYVYAECRYVEFHGARLQPYWWSVCQQYNFVQLNSCLLIVSCFRWDKGVGCIL